MTQSYYVSFDTRDMPGLIKAVKVTLSTEIVRDPKTTFPINLCEDPLYEHLEAYVLANPSSKRRR